jgi:hypothetical protein
LAKSAEGERYVYYLPPCNFDVADIPVERLGSVSKRKEEGRMPRVARMTPPVGVTSIEKSQESTKHACSHVYGFDPF